MGDVVQPIGVITLSILVGEHSHVSFIMADFMVVKLREVTLTYHLNMKFSTATRVGEVKGE